MENESKLLDVFRAYSGFKRNQQKYEERCQQAGLQFIEALKLYLGADEGHVFYVLKSEEGDKRCAKGALYLDWDNAVGKAYLQIYLRNQEYVMMLPNPKFQFVLQFSIVDDFAQIDFVDQDKIFKIKENFDEVSAYTYSYLLQFFEKYEPLSRERIGFIIT
jgi:hypothetical protein